MSVFDGESDLSGRTLTVATEFRDRNPRKPASHGWVAFEVLRRAPGSTLTFEEYEKQLFKADAGIRTLAAGVSGKRNGYKDLKHIRCDIFRGAVTVEPPLPRAWFEVQRCSPGTQPYGSSR